MKIGTRVRVERDETKYPPKGTWPRFRGKTGTLVSRNGDEYGVIFGPVWLHPETGRLKWSGVDVITWFKRYELTERNK